MISAGLIPIQANMVRVIDIAVQDVGKWHREYHKTGGPVAGEWFTEQLFNFVNTVNWDNKAKMFTIYPDSVAAYVIFNDCLDTITKTERSDPYQSHHNLAMALKRMGILLTTDKPWGDCVKSVIKRLESFRPDLFPEEEEVKPPKELRGWHKV